MKNKTIKVIGLVIVGILLFYAGTQYAKSQPASTTTAASAFAGRSSTRAAGAATGAFGGGTSGTVVSIDSQSITISLKAGGSQIVFSGTSTPITLTTNGTPNDIQMGSNIIVTGTSNSDGSLSAQSIRIEPSMPATQ